MTEAGQEALARLAPLLRGRRPVPNATISYEVLSDGLVWSDECPEPRLLRTIDGWQVLRFVFPFRTQLILGRQEDSDPDPEGYTRQLFRESRDAWNEGRRLFPDWPGFDSRRWSPDLRTVYESLSAEIRRELEEIERELDAGNASSYGTIYGRNGRSGP